MATIVNPSSKKVAKATIKSVIPAHVDRAEINDLGSGLCRGSKWQKNNWPKDEGNAKICYQFSLNTGSLLHSYVLVVHRGKRYVVRVGKNP